MQLCFFVPVSLFLTDFYELTEFPVALDLLQVCLFIQTALSCSFIYVLLFYVVPLHLPVCGLSFCSSSATVEKLWARAWPSAEQVLTHNCLAATSSGDARGKRFRLLRVASLKTSK